MLAHNFGASELLYFRKDDRTLIRRESIGTHAHNIWFDGLNVRICSSAEGALVGTDGFRKVVGGFPRGYAETATERFVGLNEHSHRSFRDNTESRILVLDKAYIERLSFPLSGEGMILDIQILTVAQFDLLSRFAQLLLP